MNHRIIAFVAFCLILMGWAVSAAAQGSISSAALGTGVTDKFEIINPTNVFSPDTQKIYCAGQTVTVKAKVMRLI